MTAWTITRQREAEAHVQVWHGGRNLGHDVTEPFNDLLAAYIELAEAVERDACMGYPAGAATNHVRAFREEPDV